MNTIVTVTISSTDPVTIKDERKEIAQGILSGKFSVRALREWLHENRNNLTTPQQLELSTLIDGLEKSRSKKNNTATYCSCPGRPVKRYKRGSECNICGLPRR